MTKGTTGHWQDKRFYLNHTYKYGLHKIIAEHRKLPPRVKGAAQIILGLFGDKASFPHNLEELACLCGVTDKTFRKYREIIEEFGIFRFDVPPYWRRRQTQFETATIIYFPTKRVERWLRDKGYLTNIGKKARCSGSDDQQFDATNTDATGTTSQPSVKNDTRRSVKEPVSTKRLTPLEAAPTSPRTGASAPGASPTAPHSAGPPKGAEFYDEATDEGFWVDATQDKPDAMDSDLEIGARVVDSDGTTGTIIGFSADETLADYVLVRYESQMFRGQKTYEVVTWQRIDNITVTSKPKATAEPASLPIGTRVTRRGLFLGEGTVVKHAEPGSTWGDVWVAADINPTGKISCWSRELVVVAPALNSSAELNFTKEAQTDDRSVSDGTAQTLDR